MYKWEILSEVPDAVTVLLHLKHKTINRPYVISVFRFYFTLEIYTLNERKKTQDNAKKNN